MKEVEERVKKYIDGVVSGKIASGRLLRLAYKRHLKDLTHADQRGWVFNKAAALHAISFFRFLNHGKDEWAGKRFDLEDWEMAILWVAYGWYNKDGKRRFRYIYIEVAKKNGKTTFMAGVGLYHFIADNVTGAEVYAVAAAHKQAKICFNEAKRMVRSSPHLQKMVTVFEHNMHISRTGSKFEAMSSQYESQEGVNPSCAIVDEYHVHKNSDMFDLIKSAIGARESPLVWVITTAGFDKDLPCYSLRDQIIQIIEGVVEQPNMTGFIFTLDKGDDWKDEGVWIKSNPNLDKSVKLRYLQEEFIDAMNKGGHREVNFKTKNLNIWVDAEDTWIMDEIWMDNAGEVNMDELIGKRCFIGVDLSEKHDITAVALLFPPEKSGDPYKIHWDFWIPEQKVMDRQDKVDYRLWADQGLINIVKGNAVDDDLIIEKIMKYSSYFEIESLGFDEWNAKKFIIDLCKAGFPEDKCSKVVQYLSILSEPTKMLYNLIMARSIAHGGNPIARWMIRNVAIKADTNLNIRIDKSRSKEKIDGISALINAMVRMLDKNEDNLVNEIYKNRGI